VKASNMPPNRSALSTLAALLQVSSLRVAQDIIYELAARGFAITDLRNPMCEAMRPHDPGVPHGVPIAEYELPESC
jgi:hypothetical protein